MAEAGQEHCDGINAVRDRIREDFAATIHRLVFDRTGEGILIADQETRLFLFANPAVCRLFGYAEDELLRLGVDDIHPVDALPWVRREFALQMAGKKELAQALPCLRKDGSVFYADIHTTKVLLGDRPCAAGFFRDVTDRVQAEKILRRNEERFREIVEYQTEMIVRWRPDGTRTFVNEPYCRYYGISAAEAVGTSFFPLLSSVDRERIRDKVAGLSPEQPAATDEQRMERKDGTVCWTEWTDRGIFDDRGVLVEVLTVGRDVTARKEAERRALREDCCYRDLMDAMPHGVQESDLSGTITYVNRAYRKMLGFRGDAPVGRKIWDMLAEEKKRTELQAYLAELVRNQPEPTVYLAKIRNHSGETIDVKVDWTYRRNAEGDLVGLVSVITEITGEKELEALLIRAKEEWEETFDVISDAITIHDDQFNIVRYNLAAVRLLGVHMDDVLTKKCYELYHGSDCPPEGCPSCRTLRTGEPSTTEIYEPHLERHLEIKALPRRNKSGEFTGLVHVVRDITARKEAEEAQKSLQEQLVQSQKMESVGRLAGGIAHDFNNMLSAITGYTELVLLKLPDDSPHRDKLRTVRDAGLRAAELTRQLLAFSRKQVLEMKPVNINGLIERMGKILGRMIGENIRVEFDLAGKIPTVEADESQIEQVVMNLVVNARDAMPGGGTLGIQTRLVDVPEKFRDELGDVEGPFVRVRFSDSGHGMQPEVREHIFEPFFTTKEAGKGTGLGLATVYGIVAQHKGVIDVESEPGRGTEFSVYLPPAGKQADDSVESGVGDLPRGQETILLVEDDPFIRNLVKDTLEPQGYTLLMAENGEVALAQAESYAGTIDLLLSDVILPGMDGKEIGERIVARRPETKVLFMSGYTDDILSPRGVLDPGVRLIQKSLKPFELIKTVHRILGEGTQQPT